MIRCANRGFIIPLTLMLISIATVLITAIYQRGTLFVPFTTTMYQREQAKMLALSGIQIAMSQLAMGAQITTGELTIPKQAETTAVQRALATPKISDEAQFFAYIFPKIGQWQEFKLKRNIDGVEGAIQIAVASEDGKINLNTIYDFVKKKFVGEGQSQGDWKKIMQQLLFRIQKKMGITVNLFEGFEKFLKQRQYKVNDASELLTIEAFRPFVARQFYSSAEKEKESSLYLMDLFTVYGYGRLQPWLLSDSIRGLFDMKRSSTATKLNPEELKKRFKTNLAIAKDWNQLLQPLYGIEFGRLPKGIDAVFETTFDPQLFSVVSYGIVGEVTLRAYAILERVRRVMKQKTWYDIKIKKFYWI